jgi:hypothetical protein
MMTVTRRFCARQENEDGQGTAEIRKGSSQAEEGEGEDYRGQSVPEGRSARAGDPGAFEEQLVEDVRGGALARDGVTLPSAAWVCEL